MSYKLYVYRVGSLKMFTSVSWGLSLYSRRAATTNLRIFLISHGGKEKIKIKTGMVK